MWERIDSAPNNELVMTKIEDAKGVRNEQPMKRSGRLWFAGDMYVYYEPTHWRPLTELERMQIRNKRERAALAALEAARNV